MKTVTGSPLRSAKHKRARPHGTSLLPLYHRVYLALRHKILHEEYPPHVALPGEHQLAAAFEVSRDTLRRVLDRLEKEGLVVRRHGAGTFAVRRGGRRADQPTLSYYDFIALASHTYEDELLEFTYVPTPTTITTRDAAFGPHVLKVSRLRREEGRAIHIVDSYLPAELGSYVSAQTVGNRTLIEILGEHDIYAASSEFRVGAVAAGSDEAHRLGVDIGAPLVHATRLSRTGVGRPIEFSRFLSVAERFGYSFTFHGDGPPSGRSVRATTSPKPGRR
jgi:GntR family transcriptional regulator